MLSEVIIAELKKKGLITEKDIEEIEDNLMDGNKSSCVKRFHLLFCSANHDEGECTWYTEEQMDNTWNQPSHRHWKGMVTSLRKALNVSWTLLDTMSVSLSSMPIPFDILLPALSSHFLHLSEE